MMKNLGPSPEHAKYQPLLPRYWKRVEQQEQDMIARGLPAEGYTRFAQRWFDGWGTQDIDLLASCMTEDCTFVDSSSFQQVKQGTIENCAQCFAAFPDIVFYPQDDSIRSLPYADYSEGEWRVAIPWRGVARFSGSFCIPETNIRVAPTGKLLNFIGVDRYTTRVEDGEWKISHIDTDWDMLYGALQLMPFPTPSMNVSDGPALKALMALERVVVPVLGRVRRIAA